MIDSGNVERDAIETVTLSADDQRKRRMRSLAIAAALICMAALFYAVTIVRLGEQALNRAQ